MKSKKKFHGDRVKNDSARAKKSVGAGAKRPPRLFRVKYKGTEHLP